MGTGLIGRARICLFTMLSLKYRRYISYLKIESDMCYYNGGVSHRYVKTFFFNMFCFISSFLFYLFLSGLICVPFPHPIQMDVIV